MNNKVQVFQNEQFGQVRTIEENGKVLFCAKDVAISLGYKDPTNAIKQHCKGVVKRHLLTDGGKQLANFIPEGDIYRLAAKSELPGADEFESWIFDEVLPTIHKHGAYMTEQTIDRILSDPDTIIKLATNLKEERAKRKALEAENEQQRQTIKDFEPIKQYVDIILESTGTLTTSQIAADYDLSARTLNKILHEEGVQHNVNGQWILYRKHMGMGYTKSKTIPITRSDGSPDTKMHTQWTQKGRMMIHEILTRRGIKAVMDKEIEKRNGERNNGDELLSACGISGTCIRVIV